MFQNIQENSIPMDSATRDWLKTICYHNLKTNK